MKFLAAIILLGLAGVSARAEPDHVAAADRLLSEVIQPGTVAFEEATATLRQAAAPECTDVEPAALRDAFHGAWDAWMTIQHLRFGPLEDESRSLQIAFWPDSRGTVGRTVSRILATENAPVEDTDAFAKLSIGARGFPALERLLFDDSGPVPPDDAFRCAYAAAVSADLERVATEINAAWNGPFATIWTTAGEEDNAVFLAPKETSQRIFVVTLGTLDETVQHRLGTPLGTLVAVRPKLAEARRSGRSLRHISLILDATERTLMTAFGPELEAEDRAALADAYASARRDLARVAELGDLPVALAESRIRVEVLQQSIERIAIVMRAEIGPALGISKGFNAADGD
ncbi:MAG: imelysin family protein [Pseudomonadota bacterium]